MVPSSPCKQASTSALLLICLLTPACVKSAIGAVCSSVSTQSCGKLGWVEQYGSVDVCAETDGIPGSSAFGWGCQINDFNGALAACTGAGARLCTLDELHNDEARNTGCGYDAERVWTSTRGNCAEGHLMTAPGMGLNRSSAAFVPSCTAVNTKVATRCCADDGSAVSARYRAAFQPCTSVLSCRELNWTATNPKQRSSSCAEAGRSSRRRNLTHADALTMCHRRGARLCTRQETFGLLDRTSQSPQLQHTLWIERALDQPNATLRECGASQVRCLSTAVFLDQTEPSAQ